MHAIKLIHLITGLNTGGAEMMLLNLLKQTNRERFSPVVISLMDQGALGERIEALGIPVHAVHMQQGRFSPQKLSLLWKLLRREKPDLIQGWMYHANLLGLVFGKLRRVPHIFWGLHHTNLDPSKDKKATIKIAKFSARLSGWTSGIIACSHATFNIHAKLGYRQDKMTVIPNGFDLEAFSPNPQARIDFRNELGLDQDAILIGLIARFHPQKDHHNFFKAAKNLITQVDADIAQRIHFVLCGEGVDHQNKEILQWVKTLDLDPIVHLLGVRKDVANITAALDIATSASSHGEAFPLIIGEAMACQIPCVVTDVGDAAMIVEDAGLVVPPKHPHELSLAWQKILSLSPQEYAVLGSRARRRIQEQFSISSVVQRYESLYEQACIAS